jgi:hypothetical protein
MYQNAAVLAAFLLIYSAVGGWTLPLSVVAHGASATPLVNAIGTRAPASS